MNRFLNITEIIEVECVVKITSDCWGVQVMCYVPHIMIPNILKNRVQTPSMYVLSRQFVSEGVI
jgi:hypothetical protein